MNLEHQAIDKAFKSHTSGTCIYKGEMYVACIGRYIRRLPDKMCQVFSSVGFSHFGIHIQLVLAHYYNRPLVQSEKEA